MQITYIKSNLLQAILLLIIFSLSTDVLVEANDFFTGKFEIENLEKTGEKEVENFEKDIENETENDQFLKYCLDIDSASLFKKIKLIHFKANNSAHLEIFSPPPESNS